MTKTNGKIVYYYNKIDILIDRFPRKYPDILPPYILHECPALSPITLPKPCIGKVIGYVDDTERLEVLVLEVDGKMFRAFDKHYYITWSLDRSKGGKGVQSHFIIERRGMTKIDPIIDLVLTPAFIPLD